MENRKRNVQIIVRVTEEERVLIEEKMKRKKKNTLHLLQGVLISILIMVLLSLNVIAIFFIHIPQILVANSVLVLHFHIPISTSSPTPPQTSRQTPLSSPQAV